MPGRKKTRVMVFGAFDQLHPGHLYFLYHARLLGDELIAVVARDTFIKRFKKHPPRQPERSRTRNVKATGLATRVVLGDERQGSYRVLKRHRPDVVALGYDQRVFAKDLRAKIESRTIPKLKIVKVSAYKPRMYHSSKQPGR